jgi:hypothetical protein
MKRSLLWATLAVALSLSLPTLAQAPAAAPAGSTGLCNDGTYYSGPTKKGACRGHKGVKDWYASAATAAPAAAPAVAAPAAHATPAAPATPAKASAPSAVAAGGGPGMVWVNTPSKVYHCNGSRWYGKTKQGAYMTEAAAKAQGNRPDHGKDCK